MKQEEPFPSAKVGVSCELANGLKPFSEKFLFPWVAQLGEEMCHNLKLDIIFEVRDIKAYIIVREYDWGDFVLHSISDAQDFIKHVKKK